MASDQINGWNGARLDDLAEDLKEFKAETKTELKSINSTLTEMLSDEIRDLKTRADRPRVFLYAVAGPVVASICTLVVTHGGHI